MKTVSHLLAIALAVITLVACGGNGKKKTAVKTEWDLTPMQTEVKGYLSGVLEVMAGSYKFGYSNNESIIQVKIKSVGKSNSSDAGFTDGNYGPLYLAICDSLDRPIAEYDHIPSSYKSDGLLKDMVSRVGEENWVSFGELVYGKNRLPDNAVKFYVFSKKIDDDRDSSFAVGEMTGGAEWDKLLDEYEEYITKYIAAVKSVASNKNAKALKECSELMMKAEKLAARMESAKNKDVSAAQLSRLTNIISKFSNAQTQMEKLEDAIDDAADDDLFGADDNDDDW